ncbi:hypothetical protein [uncultured Methanolobus sp.]|nr:hypothetical protein [uncultured Methanolobus sp.]
MNLALQMGIVAAKNHISNLSDDDFKQVAEEMQTFIKDEHTKRGLTLGH